MFWSQLGPDGPLPDGPFVVPGQPTVLSQQAVRIPKAASSSSFKLLTGMFARSAASPWLRPEQCALKWLLSEQHDTDPSAKQRRTRSDTASHMRMSKAAVNRATKIKKRRQLYKHSSINGAAASDVSQTVTEPDRAISSE